MSSQALSHGIQSTETKEPRVAHPNLHIDADVSSEKFIKKYRVTSLVVEQLDEDTSADFLEVRKSSHDDAENIASLSAHGDAPSISPNFAEARGGSPYHNQPRTTDNIALQLVGKTRQDFSSNPYPNNDVTSHLDFSISQRGLSVSTSGVLGQFPYAITDEKIKIEFLEDPTEALLAYK
ncbi:unnamed protein product [Clavelina lepadiformis]|uniref:Uncharacterized protein n=1 Tax=Clavelina lepadiformis TaxID=159417 RepID=A0ABP0FEE0_CLALP